MKRIQHINGSVCVLAGLLAGAIAALAAALATAPPPAGPVLTRFGLTAFRPGKGLPGGTAGWKALVHAPAHTAVTGVPGWQIPLIVIAAALLAAAVALLADRAWITRRHATAKVA